LVDLRENFRAEFDLGQTDVWLNAAHQGALPDVAARAAEEAIAWKRRPWKMTAERFAGVPGRLRELLAALIGADPDDLFLANGASYGLHLLANGLPLAAGDEVLCMQGDFPSNTLPWQGLQERGVVVRALQPQGQVLQPDEIERAIGPRTRTLCLSWVHSFSGWTLDIAKIGELCRANDIVLIVNVTQGLGAAALDVRSFGADAVVDAGWKWLCGPYATGFGWIRPELFARMRYNQRYWLSLQSAEELGHERDDPQREPPGSARRYDIFGTANFFNFAAWAAGLELLSGIGLAAIGRHDQRWVDRFLDDLDTTRFDLISPRSGSERSTLIFLDHRDAGLNRKIYERCLASGVHVAFRRGKIRVAPHLYNTDAERERLLELLNG